MVQHLKVWLIVASVCARSWALRNRARRVATNQSGVTKEGLGKAPPLRLFSTTWNSYNRIWDTASDADDVITKAIDGHSVADLVMIGFQEYYDEAADKSSVADRLKSNLWKGVFAEKALGLHQMPRKQVPEEVLEAKQKILDKFQAYHDEVDQALKQIGATFGKAAPEHFSSQLKNSLVGVHDILQKHKREHYDEHFRKINSWSEAMDAEHRNIMEKIPNFKLDLEGRLQHESFANTFQKVPVDAYTVLDSRYESAKQKIQAMLQDVEVAAAKVAATKIAEIQTDINQWQTDVNRYVGRIGQKRPLNLQHKNMIIPSISETFDSDSKLRKRRSYCHGWPAHHYNTDLRIFVNPWSPWRLDASSIETYSIDHNGEASGIIGQDGQCGKGVNVVKVRLEATTGHKLNVCMINVHLSYKFPFLQRLYNIKDALDSLKGAHEFNPKDLQCDMVAMTGDFNSRLTCKPAAGRHSKLDRALCDTPQSPTGGPRNSFQTIMNTFCDRSGQCSLSGAGSGADAQADELTQFMSNEKVNCFEDKQKDKNFTGDWFLHSGVDNVLWSMGVSDGHLREVGPPNFAPTYKLDREKHAIQGGNGDRKQKIAEWGRCLSIDPGVCVLNKEQDYKHNPGWTDRILVKDSKAVTITTDLYERRTFTSYMCHKKKKKPDTCSDHAVVTALLSVSVGMGMGIPSA